MTLRSPLAAVLVAVGCGILLGVGLASGTPLVQNLLGLLLLGGGLAAPLVAAFRLGREAIGSRPLRRRLLVVLGVSGLLAVGLGWWGIAGTMHFIFALLGAMGVALLGGAAVLTAMAFEPGRPGRAGLDRVARGLWTAVLAGGVLYLSLPVGWGFQVLAIRRAKAWVEGAAVEVRAVEASTGSPPANLEGILGRIGSPPRLVPEGGGYYASGEGESFAFRIDDPSQLLPGWWVYDGKTGKWRREFF